MHAERREGDGREGHKTALPGLPLSLQMETQLLAAEARMEELVRESTEGMEQKQQLLDECGRSLAAERRADQAEVRARSPPASAYRPSPWLRRPAAYLP